MEKNKDYKKEIRSIVFRFLDSKEYEVFLFGSRASGTSKKFSDYDIGITGKKTVPAHKKIMIEEALEESDIPYKVDVVDFTLVSPEFKELSLSNIEKI